MQKCKTAPGCWSVWRWLRCEHGAPSISWGPRRCVIVHHRLPNCWCTGMKPSGDQTLVCLLLLLFTISAIPHTHRWQHASMLSFSSANESVRNFFMRCRGQLITGTRLNLICIICIHIHGLKSRGAPGPASSEVEPISYHSYNIHAASTHKLFYKFLQPNNDNKATSYPNTLPPVPVMCFKGQFLTSEKKLKQKQSSRDEVLFA